MSVATFLEEKGPALYGCPLLLLYACSSNRETIRLDAARWLEIIRSPSGGLAGLAYLLGQFPEFRTLFYFRLGRGWRPLVWLWRIVWPACPALYLNSHDIGPGFYIQHGFATIVDALRIGRNCWINQQVTVGYSGPHRPTIGDNVTIKSGAIVVGDVTIGDNAIIGAGTVVVRDVPPNSTVVGSGARLVRLNGVRCAPPDSEAPAAVAPGAMAIGSGAESSASQCLWA